MAFSIEVIQEGFLTALRAAAGMDVVEQAIPDIETVRRNKTTGNIDPYVAVQFGDLQQGYRHSMAGPEGDDYLLPIYMQVVAPLPGIARKGANRILQFCLFHPLNLPHAGSMRKRPGGNMYPIVTTDGATEAYQFPSSWSLLVQTGEVNP